MKEEPVDPRVLYPSFTEPIRPVPTDTPALDPKMIALGKALFADKRLSVDGSVACASCHQLDHGGADTARFSVGAYGRHPARNTPSIFNLASVRTFGWFGTVPSLDAEIGIDLSADDRMGNPADAVAKRLQAIPEYDRAFRDALGTPADGPSLVKVLATYVRSLTTIDAPADAYLQSSPFSEGAREKLLPWASGGLGYVEFKSFGCVSCHQGENAGGNMLARVTFQDDLAFNGIADPRDTDPLRFVETHMEDDRHLVRVPGLRNVACTAPYFHDGSAATLEEAVMQEAVNQLGHPINKEQAGDIAAFLRALTGKYEGKPL